MEKFLSHLQLFFIKVNIVIHDMDNMENGHADSLLWMQAKEPWVYLPEWPRVDLMWNRNHLGIGHADVLSPERASYVQEYGFQWCVLSTPFIAPFCLPILFLNDYSSRVNILKSC